MLDAAFWKGRRVLVTGHTGFKGSWLTLLLKRLGAQIAGVALAPDTAPNLFDIAAIADGIDHRIGDITSLPVVEAAFAAHRPEIVLHLAAQSLVQESYRDPVGTYATNVLGTVHLLDAVRRCPSVRAVVVVSSDKCYDNREWVWAYRETDRLGGHDPYSNSKSCTELVTDSYRYSFFDPSRFAEHGVAIASARAGNVIGGGDWAADRLLPDAARALAAGTELVVRNPNAVRPWQHVLDPLIAYLVLAQRLLTGGSQFGEGWNFGPDDGGNASVERLLTLLVRHWGGNPHWRPAGEALPPEAMALRLDSAKARALLGWHPLFPLDEAIRLTAEWYLAWKGRADLREMTHRQLDLAIAAATS